MKAGQRVRIKDNYPHDGEGPTQAADRAYHGREGVIESIGKGRWPYEVLLDGATSSVPFDAVELVCVAATVTHGGTTAGRLSRIYDRLRKRALRHSRVSGQHPMIRRAYITGVRDALNAVANEGAE